MSDIVLKYTPFRDVISLSTGAEAYYVQEDEREIGGSNQPINKSINQSIIQSVNQLFNQSINQPRKQSIS